MYPLTSTEMPEFPTTYSKSLTTIHKPQNTLHKQSINVYKHFVATAPIPTIFSSILVHAATKKSHSLPFLSKKNAIPTFLQREKFAKTSENYLENHENY